MKRKSIISIVMVFVLAFTTVASVAAAPWRGDDTLPFTLPDGSQPTLSEILASDMTAPTFVTMSDGTAVVSLDELFVAASDVTEITTSRLGDVQSVVFNEGEIVTFADGSRGKIIDAVSRNIEVVMFEIYGELSYDEVRALIEARGLENILQDIEFGITLLEDSVSNVEVEPFSCFIHVLIHVGWLFGFPVFMCVNCGGLFM